jgi:hypothetical protein
MIAPSTGTAPPPFRFMAQQIRGTAARAGSWRSRPGERRREGSGLPGDLRWRSPAVGLSIGPIERSLDRERTRTNDGFQLLRKILARSDRTCSAYACDVSSVQIGELGHTAFSLG